MIRRPALGAGGEPLAIAATVVILLVTASPWTLGFSSSHAAVAEHIAFAMGVGPIAVLVSALPAAAVSIAVAGGWLVTSPWVLGYATAGVGAWSADLLGGLALVALAVAATRARGRRQSHDTGAATEGGRP